MRRFFPLFSFLFSVLPALEARGLGSAVPIENHGFEIDYDKNQIPDGWEVLDEATLRVSEQAMEGSFCAALKPFTGRQRTRIRSSNFPLQPGKTYVVSAWKRSTQNLPVGLTLETYDALNRPLETFRSRSRTTAHWSPIKLLFVAPEEATVGKLILEVGRVSLREPSVVYWDHCELAEALLKDLSSEEWIQVDLGAIANREWSADRLAPLSSFPKGSIRLAQIPFHIQTEGKAICVLDGRGGTPESKEAVLPLNFKAQTLYFLHCTQSSDQLDANVGSYKLLFSDGQSETILLHFDREIGNLAHPHGGARGPIAWLTETETDGPVGLNIMAWENPRPDTPLQSLSVRIMSDKVSLLLLGLTAWDGPNLFRSNLVTRKGHRQEDWIETRLPDWQSSPTFLTGQTQEQDRPFLPLRSQYGRLVDQKNRPIRLFGLTLQVDPSRLEPGDISKHLTGLRSTGCNLIYLKVPMGWDPGTIPVLSAALRSARQEGMLLALSPFPSLTDSDPSALRFWLRDKKTRRQAGGYARWLQTSLRKEGLLDEVGLWILDGPDLWESLDLEDVSILEDRWNLWLRNMYRTRGHLYDAWSVSSGQTALEPEEDPEQNTVRFLSLEACPNESILWGPEGGWKRYRDSLMFLREEVERTGRLLPRWARRPKAPILWLNHPSTTHSVPLLPKGMLQGTKLSEGRGFGWPGWTAGYLPCHGLPSNTPFLPPLRTMGVPTVVQIPGEGFLRTGAPQTLSRAAYGAFHGWDVLLIDVGDQPLGENDSIAYEEAPFLPACASLFLRRDVKESVHTIEVSVLPPPQATGWWLEGWMSGMTDIANLLLPLGTRASTHHDPDHLDRTILIGWGPHCPSNLSKTLGGRFIYFPDVLWEADPEALSSQRLRSLHQDLELTSHPSLSVALSPKDPWGPPSSEHSILMDSPLCLKTSTLPKSALTLGQVHGQDLCLGTITGHWAVLTGSAALAETLRSPEIQFLLVALNEWGFLEDSCRPTPFRPLFWNATGELKMDHHNGVFLIHTPRTLSISGHLLKDITYTAGPLQVIATTSPCSVTMTRWKGMEEDPGPWLLTVCGRTGRDKAHAFSMESPLDPTTLVQDWLWMEEGEGSWQAEPFRGTIRFTGPLSRGRLHIHPLLQDGSRGKALPLSPFDRTGMDLELDGSLPSLFFEVILDRTFDILVRR